MSTPTIGALAPWFGSNRLLASNVGREVRGCEWVGIPFGGGMSEVAHIDARAIVVNDLHRHVINLAMVVADLDSGPHLVQMLDALPFHPDTLAAAQVACLGREAVVRGPIPDIAAARDYFVACWMARSGLAGTKGEFRGSLPVRWSASGGDSNVRYRSAVASLGDWQIAMKRCNFTCLDVFEFLGKVKDQKGHGIYLDPPFPGPGDAYKHTFGEEKHRDLAKLLAGFAQARVVCRFYDHPLIRELYPEPQWTWTRYSGRKQTNDEAPEVLVINGPSYAEAS